MHQEFSPSKIIAVGLNYLEHIKEMQDKIPAEPLIFMKAPTSVIGDGDFIIYPSQTKELHYEAELAIVIEEVKNKKWGYTCANDVTARDLQRKDGQWTRAKSFNTFCPLGPKVIYGDTRLLDASKLDIKCYLNGKIVQSSNTSNMIFKIPEIIEFISSVMTLLPGDVILTGTPPGVGPMQKGDEVVVEIEGIGRLTNRVK